MTGKRAVRVSGIGARLTDDLRNPDMYTPNAASKLFVKVAVGASMGLLPEGTLGSFPAPLTFDGSVCLQLPPQYNFTAEPTQKSNIPVVYGVMHAALLCLVLMPLPLCHAGWTSLVGCAPWLHSVVPVDDLGLATGSRMRAAATR